MDKYYPPSYLQIRQGGKTGRLLNLLLEHSHLAFSIKTYPWLLSQLLDSSEVQFFFFLPSTTRLLRALLMYIFSLSCHFLLYQLLISSALDSANAMKPNVSANSILQDLWLFKSWKSWEPCTLISTPCHDGMENSRLSLSTGQIGSSLGLSKCLQEEKALLTWLLKTGLPWLYSNDIKKILIWFHQKETRFAGFWFHQEFIDAFNEMIVLREDAHYTWKQTTQ